MGFCAGLGRPLWVCLILLVCAVPPLAAWDADLELLDLVEEIPQTFYQFLSLDQVGASCYYLHGNHGDGAKLASITGWQQIRS